MEKSYHFKAVFTAEGWLENALLKVNHKGIITDLREKLPDDKVDETCSGYALPGFQNAHSHAFQYAMAGLAEIHDTHKSASDFWSWRNTMYQIALQISPDELEAVASFLYMEMLRHGYTHVAEFHYVHHQKDGKPYNQIAQMSISLMNATEKTGINLTLVPIFYKNGGFGKNAELEQRRFLSQSSSEYLNLLSAVQNNLKSYSAAKVGIGLHSLRAISKQDINEAIAFDSDLPIHIHISETLKEVIDCNDFYGLRPIEWLAENFDLNDRWNLVHATHANKNELELMGKSKVNVVLCPSTEGNLADGWFPIKDFIEMKGKWCIGTDSHIGIDPKEELRFLDYGNRNNRNDRRSFINTEQGNPGVLALSTAHQVGQSSMGIPSKGIAINEPFNSVVIDAAHPLLASGSIDKVLTTYLYSCDSSIHLGTITQGKWRIKDHKHLEKNSIYSDFIKSIINLGIRM